MSLAERLADGRDHERMLGRDGNRDALVPYRSASCPGPAATLSPLLRHAQVNHGGNGRRQPPMLIDALHSGPIEHIDRLPNRAWFYAALCHLFFEPK